jgi:tRNA A37 threonylcarbamoyladenosine dehydratase
MYFITKLILFLLYFSLVSTLSDIQIQLLKDWQPNININEKFASTITTVGKDEVRRIGERIKQAFPELAIKDLNNITPNTYMVRKILYVLDNINK